MIIKSIPKPGQRGSDVVILKKALKDAGFDPRSDSDIFDDATLSQLKNFQKSKGLPGYGVIPSHGGMTFEYLGLSLEEEKSNLVPIKPASGTTPWGKEVRKDLGKKETDPAYNKRMSGFWPLVGLNLGTISQNWAAWCGLGIAVWLSLAGFPVQKDGAGAKNWAKYGRAIDYKTQGIPMDAIVYINHNRKCGSGSGNHVTLSYGECSAQDVNKAGASFNGIGGNQGNAVKISSYPMSHICAVRWPVQDKTGKPYPMPAKVLVSKDCSGKVDPRESTR